MLEVIFNKFNTILYDNHDGCMTLFYEIGERSESSSFLTFSFPLILLFVMLGSTKFQPLFHFLDTRDCSPNVILCFPKQPHAQPRLFLLVGPPGESLFPGFKLGHSALANHGERRALFHALVLGRH